MAFKGIIAFLLAIICLPVVSYSQSSASEQEAQTVLDSSPWVSSRASGLGGAMVTIADDVDAAYYNPAGIGGLHWDKGHVPFIRRLNFPYIGVAANENAQKLNSQFSQQGGAQSAAVGSAIIDANSGKRQYARGSLLLGMVFKRFMIVPYTDHQIAAVSKGDGSDLVETRYQSTDGVGVGGSFTDPQGVLAIGWFNQIMSMKEVKGEFPYQSIVNSQTRNETLKSGTSNYSGIASNFGMIWTISKKGRPALGISTRDAGNTKLKKSDGGESYVRKQDLAMGFSLSPNVGKSGIWNVLLEANKLSDDGVSFQKKLKIGTELTFGGFGSYSTFGIRSGYNFAGPSFGLHLNLGLIALEMASQAEDVGINNRRMIERRNSATFSVNVAEF